jgi:hypothetical protein
MRAWKLIGLGLAGLIVAGGAASFIASRSAIPATPHASPKTPPPVLLVSEMIKAAEDLNSRCRGGSGDDAATLVACDQRDQMMSALEAAGTCWGDPNNPNQIGADKTWQPCSAPVAAHSTPSPAKEVPSPEIQYDPARAANIARMDSAMSVTRGCLRAQTINMVRIGQTDRDQVAQGITNICQAILMKIDVMSADEVQAMVKVMAYDAIADVERENAGG